MAQKGELRIRVSAQDRASSVLKRVTGGLVALVGAYLSIRGIREIVRIVGDFTNAAAIQEKQVAKLAQQLKNHGELTSSNIKALTDQATALQKVTAFADEQIISGQAMLASFNLTTEQLTKMTPRLLDVAVMNERLSGQQQDLATVAKMVGVALGGQAGRLTQMGIYLTKTQRATFQAANEQERFNMLCEIFDQNAEGLAEAIGQTWAGQVEKAKNQISDLKEQIGKAVTQSTAWKASLEFVTIKLADLNTWLQNNERVVAQWAQAVVFHVMNFGQFAGETLMDVISAVSSTALAMVQMAEAMYKVNKALTLNLIKNEENDAVLRELHTAFENVGIGAQNAKLSFGELMGQWREYIETAIQTKGITFDVAEALAGGAGGAEGEKPVTEAAKEASDAMKLVSDSMHRTANKMKATSEGGFMGSLVDQTMNWVDALVDSRKEFSRMAADFLKKIAMMIAKQIILNAITGGGGGVLSFLGLQTGGLVPGNAPYNDHVPAMLTPGEYVLPRSIVNALGGAGGVERTINNQFMPTVNVNVAGSSVASARVIGQTVAEQLEELMRKRAFNFNR